MYPGHKNQANDQKWPKSSRVCTFGLQLHLFEISALRCHPISFQTECVIHSTRCSRLAKPERIGLSTPSGLSGATKLETENIYLSFTVQLLFKEEVPKWNRECAGCFEGIFPLCDTVSLISIFSSSKEKLRLPTLE